MSVPIQSFVRLVAAFLLAATIGAGSATAKPIRLVALGDSLTAGLGLPESDAFPAKLEAALKARGLDIAVENAGVSGDTAKGGLARVDWSVGPEADGVIVELGANDALRGLDPAATRAALDALLARLKERHLPVLLAGMLAPRNLGPEYTQAFDAIYPELAGKYDAVLYPFFLDAVASHPELVQADGLHPTAAGVDAIVARILPAVETLIAKIQKPS
jgi:acyl-CoA thioesterase-1